MVIPIALIAKALFPSISTFETPPARSNTINPSPNDRLAPASTNNLPINGNPTGRGNCQIPPDFVVKTQALDIAEVIL
jgi:hypothetical protein